MASPSALDLETVFVTTLSVGALLPLKPASAAGGRRGDSAVSLGGDDDDQVSSACSEETLPTVVEGVGFTVVVVIAFAAFAIGVLLMSSLWFIYVKTSKLPHVGTCCFEHSLFVVWCYQMMNC